MPEKFQERLKPLEEWDPETDPICSGNDNVNHPAHYTKGKIECIKAIEASMSDEAFKGYCKGNALKYIWRYEQKGGVESLEKAKVYLCWLILKERKATDE